jgi:hypothetical protein
LGATWKAPRHRLWNTGETVMSTRMKPSIARQIFLVVALLYIGNICFAANEETSLKIDKKTVKTMIKKAEPLIEDTTGRNFKKKVKFKLVKREVVRDAILRQTLPLYKNLMKDMNEDAVDRQVETIAMANSQKILGMYIPEDKIFYVVPDNIESNLKALDVKEKDFNDFVFLIVTHELVHALDDQYFDLQRINESIEHAEPLQAVAALREGHAVYVTNQIADRLNLSDTAKELSVKSAAGVMDAGNRAQMQIFYNTYVKGEEFVKEIVKRKGVSGISDAFLSPPASTRQVMDPEEYFSPSNIVQIDCSKMIENIKPKLPIEGMQTQKLPLGATTLSALMISQGIDEKEAQEVANECINGAILIANKKTLKPKTLMVIALNFKNRESSKKFLEISKKTDDSEEAQFIAKLNSTYNVVKESSMKIDGFDDIRFRHVEKSTNGVVTTAISVEGLMNNVYLCTAFSNMNESIKEEKAKEIIKALGDERMKMLYE